MTKPGQTLEDVIVSEDALLSALGSELIDSETFRKLAQISPSMVFQTDAEGGVNYVSDRWQEITGHPATVWEGFAWVDLIVDEDRDRVVNGWAEAVRRGEGYHAELRLRHADGSTIWIWSQSVPVRRADGTVSGYVGTCTNITPVRQTVEALRESEARYRSLVDNAPVSIYEIDLNGKLTSVNQAGCTMANMTREAIVGRSFLKLTRQVENDHVVKSLERAFAGEACRLEFATQVGDSVRDFDSRLIPVTNHDGTIRGLMGVTEDVTERNRIELALKTINDDLEVRVAERTADLERLNAELYHKTAELRAIFRAFPDLQFRLLLDGTIKGYVAGRDEDLFTSPERFLEKKMQDVVPPSVGSLFSDALAEVARTRMLVSIEYALEFADGERVFEARLVPLGEDELIVNCRDVTERHKLDATLRASEEKYRTIVDMSSEGIWTIDADAKVTFANDSLAKMLGYTVCEIIGKQFYDYLDVQSRAQARELLNRRGEGRGERRDFRFERRDGSTLWAILSASPVFGENDEFQGALIMLTDITERKRAEEALRRHEHLASVGTLAAGISHEINNPLAALMIAAGVARNTAGDPSKARQLNESVELISSRAERIRQIVKNVQQLAQHGVLQKFPCNIAELAHKARERTLAYAATKGIDVLVESPDDLPEVPVTALEIEQVLINLIHNAVDATDDGQPIRVRLSASNDSAKIVVQDAGRGMNESVLQRIFDPFYTTREYDGGTGLGLAISHVIVRRHRGALDVQSEPGVGTMATVSLPLQMADG
jgi:PAS domain S-box-containing protein